MNKKLMPAQSKDYAKNELFIVEGDSAGGTAKKGRDRLHQAILPLRGKPLNTDSISIDRLVHNEEIATIINTIGAGFGQSFDIEDIKYGKIIIMTDADTDGAHIQTLLLKSKSADLISSSLISSSRGGISASETPRNSPPFV